MSIIPVVQSGDDVKFDESKLPDALPVLALRNAVLMPGTIFPITIGREMSRLLIEDAYKHKNFIGAVPQLDAAVEEPKVEDLYKYGTVARILNTIEMPDGTITAILQGLRRFEVLSITRYDPYMMGLVHYLQDRDADPNDPDIAIMASSIKEKATLALRMGQFAPKEAAEAMRKIDDFNFLVNFVGTSIEVENFTDKMELLQWSDIKTRGMKLLKMLDTQIELLKIKQDINNKVKAEIDQQPRE